VNFHFEILSLVCLSLTMEWEWYIRKST